MKQERTLRLLPEDGQKRNSPFEMSKMVPVKWNKNEDRLPHINFYGCRYKGKCLANLINHTVNVIYDYRDIRKLQVQTSDGRLVGEVYAPESWQHFPHGVKTRQYINKFCRVNKLKLKDPLVEYFWLQLQHKNAKKSTLEILYREIFN